MNESDSDVRRAVIAALGEIGPAAQPASPLIARDLNAVDGRLKQAARRALEKIGGPDAERGLAATMEGDAVSDRIAAQNLIAGSDPEGLGRLFEELPEGRRQALAAELMHHEDPDVALVATLSLLRLRPSDAAVERLADIVLQHERGPELLTGIAWSFMHSGNGDQFQDAMARLVPVLEARLENAPPEVRERFQSPPTPAGQE